MQPSDDMVPEEVEQSYKEFVTFLRQSISIPAPATSFEQSQILARVQEHLPKTGVAPSSLEEEPSQQGTYSDFPQERQPLTLSPLPDKRIRRFVNTAATVLVVGAMIAASLLLFTHHAQIATGSSVGPVGTPVMLQTQAGNVAASMQITAGPYFLSELLAVDVTLTNHTQNPIFLAQGPCNPALYVAMSGGNAPDYTVPVNISFMSCISPPLIAINPGKAITAQLYVPLTKSGQVTLTAGTEFYTVKTDSQGTETTMLVPDPLAGHWPSIRVTVTSLIPSDRTLALQRLGTQVTVNAPPDVRSHLVYLYAINCKGTNTDSTNGTWSPLTTKIFSQPPCPEGNPDWTYAVAAPGYAIAS